MVRSSSGGRGRHLADRAEDHLHPRSPRGVDQGVELSDAGSGCRVEGFARCAQQPQDRGHLGEHDAP